MALNIHSSLNSLSPHTELSVWTTCPQELARISHALLLLSILAASQTFGRIENSMPQSCTDYNP